MEDSQSDIDISGVVSGGVTTGRCGGQSVRYRHQRCGQWRGDHTEMWGTVSQI